jgi:hypothetical protein
MLPIGGVSVETDYLVKGFSVALATGKTDDLSQYQKVMLGPGNQSVVISLERSNPDSTVLVNTYIDVKNPSSVVRYDSQQLNSNYFRTTFTGSVNISLYYGKLEDLLKDTLRNDSKLFKSVWQFSFKYVHWFIYLYFLYFLTLQAGSANLMSSNIFMYMYVHVRSYVYTAPLLK